MRMKEVLIPASAQAAAEVSERGSIRGTDIRDGGEAPGETLPRTMQSLLFGT